MKIVVDIEKIVNQLQLSSCSFQAWLSEMEAAAADTSSDSDISEKPAADTILPWDNS